MKKIIITLVASAFAMSAVQATEYPDACVQLEDLTAQVSKLSPEMAAALNKAGTEQERKEKAREAFAKMDEAEQEQVAQDCQKAVKQMKKIAKTLKIKS